MQRLGRFYTAGVSYFQYRVPAARSNLYRTSELYVAGTAHLLTLGNAH